MNDKKLPEGWDEAKVRRVLAHYESQPEEEALAEDQEGIRPSETVMSVPKELVSEIRQLIAKRQR